MVFLVQFDYFCNNWNKVQQRKKKILITQLGMYKKIVERYLHFYLSKRDLHFLVGMKHVYLY